MAIASSLPYSLEQAFKDFEVGSLTNLQLDGSDREMIQAQTLVQSSIHNTLKLPLEITKTDPNYAERITGIALTIIMSSNLIELTLRSCIIRLEDIEKIASGLILNSTLTELTLNQCQLRSKGTKRIARVLSSQVLFKLNLWDNQIDDTGAIKLADALSLNHNLRELELAFNDIGPSGAERLAETLKANSNLRLLSLKSNRIGSQGATALFKSLRSNSTLERLVLTNNHIGREVYREVIEFFRFNLTLDFPVLIGNAFTKEQIRVILIDYGGRNKIRNTTLVELLFRRCERHFFEFFRT